MNKSFPGGLGEEKAVSLVGAREVYRRNCKSLVMRGYGLVEERTIIAGQSTHVLLVIV